MIFTIRFRVLLGLIVLFVILSLLTYNQYLLTKRLNDQDKFNVQTLKTESSLRSELTASNEASVKEVRPTVTPKPNLSVR